MAATSTAMLQQQPGSSVDAAWPQVTPNGVASQNLDLIQIISIGGSILVNVDHAGAVHKPASSPTNGTRVGLYQTRLTSAATLAAIFADTFSNPSLLDILQVIQPNDGSIVYYLDRLGVAH